MKVRAARTRDLEDIELLMRQIGIATMQEARDIHRAVYPHDEIPWPSEERIKVCIRELGEEREPDARSPDKPARDVGYER